MKRGPSTGWPAILLAMFLPACLLSGCLSLEPMSRPQIEQLFKGQGPFWASGSEQAGIRILFKPCIGQDSNLRFLDTDLSKMEILPAYVLIQNDRSATFSWEVERFVLQTDRYRAAAARFDEVRDEVLRGANSRIYSQADLDALGRRFQGILLQDGELRSGESDWGLVFFKGVKQEDFLAQGHTQLVIRNARLDGRETTLPFPLLASRTD
jgi:hypothetical protein